MADDDRTPDSAADDELRQLRRLRRLAAERVALGDERAAPMLAALEQLVAEREQARESEP